MRILLPLLTLALAAPLLAQEEKPQEKAPQAQAETETETKPKKASELTKAEVRKLVEQMMHGDEESQKKAAAALRDLDMEQVFRVIRDLSADKSGSLDLQLGFPEKQEMRIIVASPQGSEVISGTQDGWSYTLKSLGDGRYKLEATRANDDGSTAEELAGQGTMKELQSKHAFLKGAFGLRLPLGLPLRFDGVSGQPAAVGGRTFFVESGRSSSVAGLLARPASEALRHHLALPTGAGLVVEHVAKGSRADQLGLQRFDVIFKIGGELVDSPKQLEKLEQTKGVVEIIRRAKPRTIELKAPG